MNRATVLYDARCRVCRTAKEWLARQEQLVPLELVAAASPEARRRFPFLDHERTLSDLTVLADTGEVWYGPKAFVMCLWALRDHRALAERLSTPRMLPLARRFFAAVSTGRKLLGTVDG